MSYRSHLEARVARKTSRAIADFELIEDGDRVMVGLSGGKDSWALMQMLDVLRRPRADRLFAGSRERRLRVRRVQARRDRTGL